jgi:DMSO/TMAO reductase YedYZ molybdopterin-dependent catalytic subunit
MALLLGSGLPLVRGAKWIRGIELLAYDKPGFWEENGYHIYGDPRREQRYSFSF